MNYQVQIVRTTLVVIDADSAEGAIASSLAGQGIATTTIKTSAVPKPASSHSGDEKTAKPANQ